MITLKELLALEVCHPDWIQVGRKILHTERAGIPEELLNFPVKELTGWDDGLTVVLAADGYETKFYKKDYRRRTKCLRK